MLQHDNTFQYVHALVVQVVRISSCVVEVPCPVKVVDLRCPYTTASVWGGVFIDDLGCCGLESFDGGGT